MYLDGHLNGPKVLAHGSESIDGLLITAPIAVNRHVDNPPSPMSLAAWARTK